MVANTRLFWTLAGFFLVADIGYIIWSMVWNPGNMGSTQSGAAASPIEWVGTVGLSLSAILAALIAFYLGRIYAGQNGELPEDRVNANIDDGDAEQGFFSPWSWWPMMLAAGLTLLFLGIAVGVWIALIGAVFTGISVIGFMYEYYRGNFAH